MDDFLNHRCRYMYISFSIKKTLQFAHVVCVNIFYASQNKLSLIA
jgi:hypothetical protein